MKVRPLSLSLVSPDALLLLGFCGILETGFPLLLHGGDVLHGLAARFLGAKNS
jgi:hypothetical protein